MVSRRTITTSEAEAMRGPGSTAAVAALLGALFVLQPAAGQDAASVTVDVAHCVESESDAERLACFAAQVDAALDSRGTAEPDGPAAVIENIEDDRGRNADRETLTEPLAVDEPRTLAADEGEYFGTIVAIHERLPNSYVITLDNGQIWEQAEPKRYLLRPGFEVRIYPTRWGEFYRLSAVGSGGHIQVRRVQ